MPNAIKIGDINITINAGNGNFEANPIYYADAINDVINQENAVAIQSIYCIIDDTMEVTCIFAVDAESNLLATADNYIAIPCPPFC